MKTKKRPLLQSPKKKVMYYPSPIGCLKLTVLKQRIYSLSLVPKKSSNTESFRLWRSEKKLSTLFSHLDTYFFGKSSPDLHNKNWFYWRGTAFQKKVWSYLLTIPFGKTETYGQVAKGIGAPKAARAVGTACRRNPFLICVPCHRVVLKTGGLGGYLYGKNRKLKLLNLEKSKG